MTISDWLSLVLLIFGAFLMLGGSIGMIRLPDFYSRTHATGKTDTFGIILVLTGLAVHEGPTLSSVKLVIAILFVAVVNPTAVHALADAALRVGLKPQPPSRKRG